MATRYQRIVPVQEPFDLGAWQEYAQWAFNVQITRAYSTEQVGKELAAVLVAAGVGTYGTDLFVSSMAKMPSGCGPFIFITMAGGLNPVTTHSSPLPHQQRPSAQVLVRAKDDEHRVPIGGSAAAEQTARAAYAALAAVVNQDVTAVV